MKFLHSMPIHTRFRLLLLAALVPILLLLYFWLSALGFSLKSSISHFVIALVTIATAGICVAAVARSITVPVEEMARCIRGLREGDLTRRVQIQSGGELGDMASTFNQMADTLQELIGEMRQTTASLTDSSQALTKAAAQMGSTTNTVSQQAQDASSAAGQVSRNAQTVATGTEEMSASIREIAQHASEAARVATNAVEMAESTNTIISQLGESSALIGQVVNVITDIAEQTNLLALNATIEAARVGEAGKGFAVVANEVKDLARETGKATEDIRGKILTIQEDTGSAVKAIGDIREIINRINEFQNTIACAVEEQTATTNEMSRNVSEAARSSSDIAESFVVVAQTTQEADQAMAEIRGSAEDLVNLSNRLRNLVDAFQT